MNLSIVIPIYNVAEYLPRCLASLPDNCKIILVNDGSTDNSDEICVAFSQGKDNILLIEKENGGLSDARNAGMKYVDSEYVFFLDSDDWIDSSILSKALEYATEHDLDWVQCGYAYDFERKMLISKSYLRPCVHTKESVMSELSSNGYIKNFAWGKIYRSSIVKKYDFPLGKFFEDSYWQYKIIHNCHKFGIYPAIVTYYRQRSNSISGTFSSKNLDLIQGLSEQLEFVSTHYKSIAPNAALNLWIVAEDCAKYAANAHKDIKSAYDIALSLIKEKYNDLIQLGIQHQSLFYRMLYHNKFNQNKYMTAFYSILIRGIETLKRSDNINIRK